MSSASNIGEAKGRKQNVQIIARALVVEAASSCPT